jgi:hypothetical protein
MGTLPHQNQDRYCEFHEANGHYIEGYIALRLLIEKFIKNDKLEWFLGNQRDAGTNREDRAWDMNPRNPRDHQTKGHRPRGNWSPRREDRGKTRIAKR